MSEAGSAVGRVTLGIDIGTTSVKAVAADEHGNVVARARVPHAVQSRRAGELEHDVDEAWRDGVRSALDQVARGLDVAAANVSAMVPSLGAVDGEGRGVGPGLLYGDRRGEHADTDPTQPGDRGELLAFLAWHAKTSPGAAGYWPAQAVANHALTGRGAIDSTTAMTAHPLFDFVGWDEALAARPAPPRPRSPTSSSASSRSDPSPTTCRRREPSSAGAPSTPSASSSSPVPTRRAMCSSSAAAP